MAQRGVNEAKLEIYRDLQGPEEGRAGAAGRPPEAGMRTAVRIGGGAAGTAVRIGGGAAGTAGPTGPLQGPEQERKGER